MKKYEKYKAVDEQWCSELPAHWVYLRLKRVLQERKERNNPIKTDFILSLTAKQGVVPHAEKEGAGGNKPKDDLTKYNVAQIGDLLVNCMNVVSGAAGVSKWQGAISPVYYALHPRCEEINIRYYHYLFRLMPFQRSLLGLGKGIMMHESDEGVLTTVRMRIAMDYLNNVMLPVPPKFEQDQIVRYLDWQISRIHKLIVAKRKQITLLVEQRQSLIDSIVLYGLDKKRQMKPSEVDWINEIPAEWDITRFSRIYSFRKGLSITKANLTEEGIPVISYGQVHSKTNFGTGINDTLIRFVPPSYLETNRNALVENGDFIFADTSEDFAGVGNSAYVDLDGDLFAGYHTIIAHPKKGRQTKYFAYLYQSSVWRFQLRRRVNGVKVFSITQRILKDTSVLIPPEEEQSEIVAYLDKHCFELNEAIKRINREILECEELRVRIISDAISGKMDVQDINIPFYDAVGETAIDDLDEDEEIDEGIGEEYDEV